MTNLEAEKHAKSYRTTSRTIRKWAAERAPLNDPKRMIAWLASRKHLPPETATWLASRKKAESAQTPFTPSELKKGAPAALERLENAEADAYDQLQHALKGGDAFEIKTARQTWLQIGGSLRHYDAQLAGTLRDGEEKISRKVAKQVLMTFAWSLRVGIERELHNAPGDLLGLSEPRQAAAVLKRATWQAFAVASAIVRVEDFPEWAADALGDDLENFIKNATDRQKALAQCIREFIDGKL